MVISKSELLKRAFREYIQVKTSEIKNQWRMYPPEISDALSDHFRVSDDFIWEGPVGIDEKTLREMHVDFLSFYEMEEKGELYRRIADSAKPLRVLDAGCGFGNDSLLFGMAGASVSGVDLMTKRLTAAEHRKRYFESELGRSLDVTFINADIFKVLDSVKFDAICIHEAISHIHPLEEFLSRVHQLLPIGGQVFVSDSNYINPCIFKDVTAQFWKAHRRLTYYVHGRYKDPQTHESVLMAEERVFTLFGIRRIFERAGFTVRRNDRRGFWVMRRRRTAMNLEQLGRLKRWEQRLGAIPVLNWFGGRNVLVAEKTPPA